ncbi:hypothetical protein, partial [Brevibacillus gelatini]|uniref:hypothetical protein n=1 Tax=Brevibacillus gelatini TaxID=1655277 RepID=UPI001B87CC70
HSTGCGDFFVPIFHINKNGASSSQVTLTFWTAPFSREKKRLDHHVFSKRVVFRLAPFPR